MKILKTLKYYAKDVKKTAGKTGLKGFRKWVIMWDIVYCRMRFGATCREYRAYHLHRYKNNYRKNFLLFSHLHKRYGNDMTLERSKFDKVLAIKIGFSREILMLPSCGEETFVDFARRHKKFVLKPDNGNCGDGVAIREYTDDGSVRMLFQSITQDTLCEEYICQHEEMNRMNPHCVNTIRVVTLLSEEKFHIVCATLKTGITPDAYTDNFHTGGIGAAVDTVNGVVNSYARGYKEDYYIDHPITGEPIFGKKIPHWNQVIELLNDAHRKIPNIPVIGWDIAIIPDGVEIVEANIAPGPLLMQLMDGTPKGEEVIKHMKRNKK